MELSFKNEPDFSIEEAVRRLGPRIVQILGQDYAFAPQSDGATKYPTSLDFFDWHSDGAYHLWPPRYVLLHCLDPGTKNISTELADIRIILDKISKKSLYTLGKLYTDPILNTKDWLLPSRGYVNPLVVIKMLLAAHNVGTLSSFSLDDAPSIDDINCALTELYFQLDKHAQTYPWQAGDTLIFDQYHYLHRRTGRLIDKQRKLIILWFT